MDGTLTRSETRGRLNLMSDWPKRIRAWRKRKAWSQDQAAQALHIPTATLRDWEQGRRQPTGLAAVALNYIISPASRRGKWEALP